MKDKLVYFGGYQTWYLDDKEFSGMFDARKYLTTECGFTEEEASSYLMMLYRNAKY